VISPVCLTVCILVSLKNNSCSTFAGRPDLIQCQQGHLTWLFLMDLRERVNIAANVPWQLVCRTNFMCTRCIVCNVSFIYLLHIKLVLQTNYHTIKINHEHFRPLVCCYRVMFVTYFYVTFINVGNVSRCVSKGYFRSLLSPAS
jgi:hypothetical protein